MSARLKDSKMFVFIASSRISGAMYLWGTQGHFAGAKATAVLPRARGSPVTPHGAGSCALPSPEHRGDRGDWHTMPHVGQRAPSHSRVCNLLPPHGAAAIPAWCQGRGDMADGGRAARGHPRAAVPDPPPGAHAGVLGDVDGVQHRVVLHRQAQVSDGTGLVPLHQDVLGFQIPVSDRWLPCSQQEKPPPVLVTTVWILM